MTSSGCLSGWTVAKGGLKLVKLERNSAGFEALLKDPGVAADLARRAEAIQAALPTDNGEEWTVSAFIGGDRAQAIVKTANSAARRSAAEDFALQRALDAGR